MKRNRRCPFPSATTLLIPSLSNVVVMYLRAIIVVDYDRFIGIVARMVEARMAWGAVRAVVVLMIEARLARVAITSYAATARVSRVRVLLCGFTILFQVTRLVAIMATE